MDKRWLYILIILIIGISCMYLIVESSTTVGKATVKVNSFLVTVPDSFNIDGTGGHYAYLINRNTHESIYIHDVGKGNFIDKNMSEKWDMTINEPEKYMNLKNTTHKKNISTMYYEDCNGTLNQITFFTKYNHTFYIKSEHFHDNNTMQKSAKSVIDSLIPNYKQKQE